MVSGEFSPCKICKVDIIYARLADMAELVDALVSGTSVSNDVQVRVLFWAPVRMKDLMFGEVAELVDALL